MEQKRMFVFRLGDVDIQCDDSRLWSEAGFTTYTNHETPRDITPYAYRRLARAISEGLTGARALMRVITLGETEAHLHREMAIERLRLQNKTEDEGEGGPVTD